MTQNVRAELLRPQPSIHIAVLQCPLTLDISRTVDAGLTPLSSALPPQPYSETTMPPPRLTMASTSTFSEAGRASARCLLHGRVPAERSQPPKLRCYDKAELMLLPRRSGKAGGHSCSRPP
jgi:hypothetical protein